MNGVVEVLAVVGIVAYVIGRQLHGEPIRLKRTVVLPAILAGIGALNLAHDTQPVTGRDLAFIAVSGVVAAGIGLAQGGILQLSERDGGLWGKLPVRGLWLWAALVASRVALGVAASAAGAHVAASTTPILLVLGLNRLAQAAVIAGRGFAAGIPFAAEPVRNAQQVYPAASIGAAAFTTVSDRRAQRDLRRSARR